MKNVALIFGGRGLEHDVSCAGFLNVYPKLLQSGYNVIPVYIAKSGIWLIRGEPARGDSEQTLNAILQESELKKMRSGGGDLFVKAGFTVPASVVNFGNGGGLSFNGGYIPIDVAFPLLHGDFGEDGTPQGALENAMIKYVGENTVTSAVCLDKHLTKLIADSLTIPTARGIFVNGSTDTEDAARRAEEELGYPLFIKPADLGSSFGVGVASEYAELTDAINKARKFSKKVIVEEKLDIDCELEVGVLCQKGKLLFADPSKIITNGAPYDYKKKYDLTEGVTLEPKGDTEPHELSKVLRYARSLAENIGIRSLCRIDFFRTRDGKILFNEINTMPGFTSTSLYCRMIEGLGISTTEMLCSLLDDAYDRRA